MTTESNHMSQTNLLPFFESLCIHLILMVVPYLIRKSKETENIYSKRIGRDRYVTTNQETLIIVVKLLFSQRFSVKVLLQLFMNESERKRYWSNVSM